MSARVERKQAQVVAKLPTIANQKRALFTKVLYGYGMRVVEKEEIQVEAGHFAKQRQLGSRGEGIGRVLVDMAGKH